MLTRSHALSGRRCGPQQCAKPHSTGIKAQPCRSPVMPSPAVMPINRIIIQSSRSKARRTRNSRTTLAVHASSAAPAASSRLQAVLDKIDSLNSQDSRTIEVNGQQVPYELEYSRWLTDWVRKLTADGNPAASEELMIVARGQHVQRWVMPRNSYPEGRTAYLQWREDLKKFHAKTVTDIMRELGYSDDSCAKVQSMIMKKNLKQEAENQIVEDALCMVFLQYQMTEFKKGKTEDMMVDIIKKTWKKMGEKGRAAALELAPSLPADELALVQKALA